MKSSDPLFQLIKSLTASEKGYFKKYFSSEESNYIKLFDAINGMEDYNEDKLLKKFKGESFVKNFSVARNYLYEAVLRSLRQYHSGKSIEDEVERAIVNLRLLFEKNLYAQFDKLLQANKATCYRYEMFEQLLLLLNIENSYNIHFAVDLNPLTIERDEVLLKMTNYAHLHSIYTSLYDYVKRNDNWSDEKVKVELTRIIDCQATCDESTALTIRAKIYFHNSWSLYYHAMGNYWDGYLAKRKILELYRSNIDFAKANERMYLLVLGNCIAMCYYSKNVDEYGKLESLIEEVHQFVNGHEENKFQHRTNYRFLLFNLLSDYTTAPEFLKNFVEELPKYERATMPFKLLDYYFNVCVVYFKLGDFNNALAWLTRLFEVSPVLLAQREYMHVYTRILELIIHFELKNFEFLYHRVVSTYRFLYKLDKLGYFEKIVLQLIRGIIHIADDNQFYAALEKFIEALKKLPSQEYSKLAHDQLDYILWAQKKIDTKQKIFKNA